MKKALVLCSGGLDSSVLAFYVKNKLKYDFFTVLFFNYGQRNLANERSSSLYVAKSLNANFVEIKMGWLGKISNSMLNSSKENNKLSLKDLKSTKKEAENWYVPARNINFVSAAMSYAESLYLKEKSKIDIFLGLKNEGQEFYPDATPEFIKSLDSISKKTTAGKFNILAPLIKKDKEDIVSLGKSMNMDLSKTYSCYVGGKGHCGSCLSCRLRQEAFYWANVKDTTFYREKPLRSLNI